MVAESLQDPEDAAERHFWGVVVKVLWTALIAVLVLAVLAALTALLGWRAYLLFCFVGLLAGASLAVAMLGSARMRELTSLVLGAVTLPVLAVYLGVTAAQNEAAFDAYGARLLPFFACAAGALLGGLWISRIWTAGREPPHEGART